LTHPLSREIEIEPVHTTLLFVDVQKYNCTWEGSEYYKINGISCAEGFAGRGDGG
jgi:hypothetical protein